MQGSRMQGTKMESEAGTDSRRGAGQTRELTPTRTGSGLARGGKQRRNQKGRMIRIVGGSSFQGETRGIGWGNGEKKGGNGQGRLAPRVGRPSLPKPLLDSFLGLRSKTLLRQSLRLLVFIQHHAVRNSYACPPLARCRSPVSRCPPREYVGPGSARSSGALIELLRPALADVLVPR